MDSGLIGESLRTFLALPLANAFGSEVEPLIQELRGNFGQIKWVRSTDIHVTLHFFGSIKPQDIERIKACVIPVTSQARPLDLFLSGIGVFPNSTRPRVIWLGIEGDTDALKKIQHEIKDKLKDSGFPSEERSFTPHLTLGRVKTFQGSLDLGRARFFPTQTKEVKEIILFQSHLSSKGPRYEAIHSFPLSS